MNKYLKEPILVQSLPLLLWSSVTPKMELQGSGSPQVWEYFYEYGFYSLEQDICEFTHTFPQYAFKFIWMDFSKYGSTHLSYFRDSILGVEDGSVVQGLARQVLGPGKDPQNLYFIYRSSGRYGKIEVGGAHELTSQPV